MQKEWNKPEKGDLFIWVGQPGEVVVPWAKLQERGVFTVYYQTEPREACHLTR